MRLRGDTREGGEADGTLTKSVKVPVRPLPSPAAQAIVEELVEAYTERMNMLVQEVDSILRRAQFTAKSLYLVLPDDLQKSIGELSLDDLLKAKVSSAPSKSPKSNLSGQPRAKRGEGQNRDYQKPMGGVAHPGSRGGKFYMDAHGQVRYGERPGAGTRDATPDEIRAQYKHFKPSPFLGRNDRDVSNALRELKVHGEEALSEQDMMFFDWWYEQGGLDEFLKSYKLTQQDLQGDLSKLQFPQSNGEVMSYEEAVHDFFLSQDWNAEDADPEDDDYITPKMIDEALQEMFERYNDAIKDPALQRMLELKAAEVEKRVNGYFMKLEANAVHYDKLPSAVVASADPQEVTNSFAVALHNMDLLFKPEKGEVGQGAGGLKGKIVPNNAMLDEEQGKHGYLLDNEESLERMNPGQLMAVYVAAHLNAVFDGRTYQVGSDLPPPYTKLADKTMGLLRKKLRLGAAEEQSVTKHLDDVANQLGDSVNRANEGTDSSLRQIMSLGADAIDDKDKIAEATEKASKLLAVREKALEAQKNDKFGDIPKSMAGGVWDGKHINEATGKPWAPFKHQAQAINWMSTVKGGILALDAGMGKTPTVIAQMEKWKQEGKVKKAIIFLPPSLMGQWPDEIANFAPGAKDKILNLYGLSLEERKVALRSDMAKNAEYILISTGTLTDDKSGQKAGHELDDGSLDPEAMNDGTGGTDNELIKALHDIEDAAVFVDEVHQGGYKTKGSVRYNMLQSVLKDREYRFGMSATPMPNHPIDLFHLTSLFTDPGSVGDEAEWEGALHGVQFNNETQQWEVSNPENIVELNKRIKPYVFHKLITDPEVEEDMGKQLPPIRPSAVDLEPSNVKDAKTGFSQFEYLKPDGVCDFLAFKRIEELQAEREEQGKEPFSAALVQMLHSVMSMGLKRQAAINPRLVDKRYRGPAPKMDSVVKDLVDHFAGNQWQQGQKDNAASDAPVVIFSSFPEKAFPLLKEKMRKAGIEESRIGEISGTKGPAERAFMQDMTNQGKVKVLLVGTMSGGAGLNLQKKSNKIFFLDEPWHPAAKRQAQGRVWRTGQKSAVNMNTYRIKGSVDMDIEEKIAGKQTMTTALLGTPDANAFAKDANEQIMQLSGRVVASGASSDQLRGLLDQLGDIPVDTSTLGEEFSEHAGEESEGNPLDTMSPEELEKLMQHQGVSAAPEGGHSSEETRKLKMQLAKVAPYITDKLDRGAEWKSWVTTKAQKAAKQRYEIKTLMAKLYEEQGDKKKAAEAQRQADSIKKQYPEAVGGGAGVQASAGKGAKAGAAAAKTAGGKAAASGKSAGAADAGKAKGSAASGGARPDAGGKAGKPAEGKEPKALVHRAGVRITADKLPFKPSSKIIGGVMDADAAHKIFGELLKNKDSSLDAFAKRVIRPMWPKDADYSPKDGLKFLNTVLKEFRKLKVLK